ncbi:MAG: ABC transporter permease [Bacteroidales bacterium]|nr:ABC transporter permease [Bacteroidales bacterium]
MRTILLIVQKEFRQIFRNKTMLPVIFIVPIVQLVLLVYAATLDMKNINLYIIDNDLSGASRDLVSKFESSPFFRITEEGFSLKNAESKLFSNDADAILNIQSGFEKRLYRENNSEVLLIIDAVNSLKAGLSNVYGTSVIRDFNQEYIKDKGKSVLTVMKAPKSIEITRQFWYNQELNFKYYMAPGILGILVTMIGMFLTAINIVREKEMGTIEQINVTPIVKYQFLIGKLLPFLIIALFELGFGLLLIKILYGVPMLGSIPLLFAFVASYLFVIIGFGLLLSTLADTQQQVMFLTFFFMIVFILMSGIFTPAESMPVWAQKVNILNPMAYFLRVVRLVLLKGSGIMAIAKDWIYITVYGVIILSLAILRYRKVS